MKRATVTLMYPATSLFWKSVVMQVEGDTAAIDYFLYKKYNIIDRRWEQSGHELVLIFEKAESKTWFLLTTNYIS